MSIYITEKGFIILPVREMLMLGHEQFLVQLMVEKENGTFWQHECHCHSAIFININNSQTARHKLVEKYGFIIFLLWVAG